MALYFQTTTMKEQQTNNWIEDEHWDYYSGLPNPKWYEKDNEQETERTS